MVVPAGTRMLDSLEEKGRSAVLDGLEAQGAAPSAPARPQASGRVLVVEDNEENQRLIRHHLESIGATVVIAENGLEALEKSAQSRFDVVLMDIQMPRMDGFQTLAALRRRGATGPVIALTAHAMKGDRERCLAAGFTDYLAKPVTGKLLLEAVQSFLTSDERSAEPNASARR
jgi:CheY-like chemotaxis protein